MSGPCFKATAYSAPLTGQAGPAREQGMVLVVALILIAAVALLGTTAIMTSSTDLKISGNYHFGLQAFHDAEAGTQAVIARLQRDGLSFPQNMGEVVTVACAVPSNFAFDSSVSLKNIGNNRYLFQITGRCGRLSKTLEVVFRRKSVYEFGLFAEGSVDLKGGSGIYGYDSRLLPHPDPGSSTGGAAVGSNTQVVAYTGTYIDGPVGLGASAAGVGAAFVHTGEPIVTGSIVTLEGRVEPDPLGALAGPLADRFAAYSTANDNGTIMAPAGVFSGNAINAGSGAAVTLTGKAGGANFYLNGLTLDTGATLTVNVAAGPVNIYLAGPLEAKNGSVINMGGLPTSLAIYSNSTGSIRFFHGSDFKGMVYAPYAAVEMKNGTDTFGAIRGKTVDIKNGGQFFFDRAIAGQNFTNGIVPLAWRDMDH